MRESVFEFRQKKKKKSKRTVDSTRRARSADSCKPFIGSIHTLTVCHVGATDTLKTFSTEKRSQGLVTEQGRERERET